MNFLEEVSTQSVIVMTDFSLWLKLLRQLRYPFLLNLTRIYFKDLKLQRLILEDDRKRWRRIAEGMGKSEAGTKKRAKELHLAV
jgi:hypothetical protein